MAERYAASVSDRCLSVFSLLANTHTPPFSPQRERHCGRPGLVLQETYDGVVVPGKLASVEPDDGILAIDGHIVEGMERLNAIVEGLTPGSTCVLHVDQEGEGGPVAVR